MAQLPITTHGLSVQALEIDHCRLTEVWHRPALWIRRHEHDALKICILLEGAFTECEELNIRSLKPMDVLVRGSRRPHANQYGGRGARSLLLEIPPDHRSASDLRAVEGLPVRDPQVARAAAAVVHAFRLRRDRAVELRTSVRWLLATIESCRRPPPPAWLERVREHLAEQWAEPFRLDRLGLFAGVHPVYLSHSFHHHMGQTLSAYSHALRVFHATELLKSTASVGAIAVECGFFDQSHFTRAFERQHQMPPGLYRKALSENQAPP